MLKYLQQMAQYNQWVNYRLVEKIGLLPEKKMGEEHGAYSGSILGILNHLYIADVFWLDRCAEIKACSQALAEITILDKPNNLHDILYDDFEELIVKRIVLDDLILSFSRTWDEAMLEEPVSYHNADGEKQQQPLGMLLLHLFNHQTHHRGQITSLLFQAGIEAEVTDLLGMMEGQG